MAPLVFEMLVPCNPTLRVKSCYLYLERCPLSGAVVMQSPNSQHQEITYNLIIDIYLP